MAASMTRDFAGILITWTTYGTWLPGDKRGWRNRSGGLATPQPLLEEWCRKQMRGEAVLHSPHDREKVEDACREHCEVRGWNLIAINARTNHVHAVVEAYEQPEKVRDQLKANCTRRLRSQPEPLECENTWTKGGDCSLLPDEEAMQAAIQYVLEAQQSRPTLSRRR
jgi:REP element-mobilizing transposase RayT